MSKKILVVEDEIVEALFLGKILGLWGYEVLELVTSGEDAIREAEIQKPDLVLMDIYIHGEMSGVEAAREIHSRFGIPVIFMSGYSDEETREKAGIAHAAGYFIKPVNYDRLKETIRSVIRPNRQQ